MNDSCKIKLEKEFGFNRVWTHDLCRGFNKGLSLSKLTGCEDNFPCLVWPSRGKFFFQRRSVRKRFRPLTGNVNGTPASAIQVLCCTNWAINRSLDCKQVNLWVHNNYNPVDYEDRHMNIWNMTYLNCGRNDCYMYVKDHGGYECNWNSCRNNAWKKIMLECSWNPEFFQALFLQQPMYELLRWSFIYYHGNILLSWSPWCLVLIVI